MRNAIRRIGINNGGFIRAERMRFKPQRPRGAGRIKPKLLPPRRFVTVTVNFAMMSPAQWHCEFVTDLVAERTNLREAQVVRIGRPSTANQASLFDDMPDMVAITNATWFREDQCALIDLCCLGLLPSRAQIGASMCVCITASLAANAFSTSLASAGDNWFFATILRCAHSAASSAELRSSISRSNSAA